MKRAYDIVVVGAGAAGCAAARACALRHPGASIALVEQGTRASMPPVMRVPSVQPFITSARKARPFLRTFYCVPEKNLAGRSLAYCVGCGLGGSSLCNDMKYMRGTRHDFEQWKDPAWTFETLLPFYKSLESNARGGSAVHGANGPLPISDVQRSNLDASMNVRFFEACEAAGVPATDDFNAGSTDGFSAMQSYIKHGSRVGVFDALVEESKHRTRGLDLLTETAVEKICCAAGKVRGVEVVHKGAAQELAASHVVVCAGALRSPLLLQRSGVGAEGAVVDLPSVGQNLITTTTVDLIFRIGNPANVFSKSISWRNVTYLVQQWREYTEERTGIFTSFLEGVAYVRSQPQRDHPDLSLQFFRTPQMGTADGASCWPLDGFTMRVTHHYPSSRGEVRYGASQQQQQQRKGTGSAATAVVLRSGLLATKEDVLAMDEGVQWVGLLTSRDGTLRSVYHVNEREENVGPFWSYNATLHRPRTALATQRDTAAFLAEAVQSGGDLFGTCAINSVVDAKLRVKGVDGLYVADSSVVPAPTVASSSTVGSAIGTRVASFIES
ncbi:putative mitochondrial oxidoreductase [Leptomonas pyrrhocoris]|uniref:Putative mitochondrial oxidoreductase n=1 Tax=Leptomonas pyrrhocoris TaxID=157538 RepID=A0A0N0VFI8_LEPPY|nr:putative mitochondrial oxidoreductase [Leptomonas pyrrhocoris]KPA81308.1 putative mitochondrial oxidoreductase [Leptomonas pyrrhocoris]|eukprot:XP_015659747.1 putative mitochondrial oxidoreductase [Leptomonas pyrrhocoris]